MQAPREMRSAIKRHHINPMRIAEKNVDSSVTLQACEEPRTLHEATHQQASSIRHIIAHCLSFRYKFVILFLVLILAVAWGGLIL